METKIVRQKNGVEIHVADAAARTGELLHAFKDCQEGRCSCPTREYEKVAALHVDQTHEGITLTVKAKRGQKIDVAEIEKCLAHTENRVKRQY